LKAKNRFLIAGLSAEEPPFVKKVIQLGGASTNKYWLTVCLTQKLNIDCVKNFSQQNSIQCWFSDVSGLDCRLSTRWIYFSVGGSDCYTHTSAFNFPTEESIGLAKSLTIQAFFKNPNSSSINWIAYPNSVS